MVVNSRTNLDSKRMVSASRLRAKGASALPLFVWAIALIGYFGPWVEHRSAALAWNAYDLFDLLRLLPEIETGALVVNLQTLRLPLVGLGVLLPVIMVGYRWPWRLGGACVGAGLALATLPPYPEIVGAWRAPGWRIPFWWSVIAIGGAFVLVWLAPKLGRFLPWIALAWLSLTGIPSLITLNRLQPALGTLHATSIAPGWGVWGCSLGFLILALLYEYQGIRQWKALP